MKEDKNFCRQPVPKWEASVKLFLFEFNNLIKTPQLILIEYNMNYLITAYTDNYSFLGTMFNSLYIFSHLIKHFEIHMIIMPILHEELETLEHSVSSPRSLSWLVMEP